MGPGRAGNAFVRSWRAAGGSVQEVVSRDRISAERAAREIGQGRPWGTADAQFDCDLLLLAVPDDVIESTAQTLAPRVSCRIAFHLSGALPADLLAPLGKKGSSLGSLHPLRAFSGSSSESWSGALVAVEGDRRAVEAGLSVAAAIGAQGREIPSASKPLYHAAAALAAGGSVALVSLATRIWTSLGLPDAESRVALAGLAVNALQPLDQRDFEQALTGPIARRDVTTVEAHQAALAQFPEARAVYGALAREILARTPGRGSEAEIRKAVPKVEPKA